MAFSLSDTKVLLQGRKKHIVWDEMNEKYYQENESMITQVPTIRPTIPIILALSIFFYPHQLEEFPGGLPPLFHYMVMVEGTAQWFTRPWG